MNRYLVRLLIAMAVVLVAGLASSSATETEAQTVDVEQSNLLIAVNVAVMCPGIDQSLDQLALNVSIVDVEGYVSDVNVDQANVHVAYNIALLSPDVTQTIHQDSENVALTGVATTADDVAVAIDQFNSAEAYSYSIRSDGSVQAILQEAGNLAATEVGPGTLAEAVVLVINQSNVAFALNLCIGAVDLDEVPEGWEECDGYWKRSPNAPSYAEAGGPEFTAEAAPPEWWDEFWEYWWGTCYIPEWWFDETPQFPPSGSANTPPLLPSPNNPSGNTSGGNTPGGNNTGGTQAAECVDDILAGNLPPLDGGFGTFSFAGCSFEQLLTTSGCDESTAAFFHNQPDGTFVVWIPGAAVEAVNEAILTLFSGESAISLGTIFIARCS